jgi:uncharacterized membrane protein YidH (DUF202 family)
VGIFHKTFMARSSSESHPDASHAPLASEIVSSPRPSSALKRSVSSKLRNLLEISSPSGRSLSPSQPANSRAASSDEDNREEQTKQNGQEHSIRRRKMAAFHPTLVLENSGSVARDHLASERTFLAYVRTSLAIASTGVALVQLFSMSSDSQSSSASQVSALHASIRSFARPLGATSVCLGIFVLLIGILRYFTVQQALTNGKFPVARVLICAIALVLLAIITIVFATLLAYR